MKSKIWLSALPFAAMLGAAAPAAAQDYSGIYIFGDSLVDSGNVDEFLAVVDPAPADKGYFQGRFSDGPNFADLLSLELTGTFPSTTFPADISPFDSPSGTSLNFAYGGAEALDRPLVLIPSLAEQVGNYADLPGGADPNALYVITIGGNDLRQLVPLQGVAATQAQADAYLASVAATVIDEVNFLFDLGAQNILLTGAPDIGLMPLYSSLSDEEEIIKRAIGTSYAEQLEALLLAEVGGLNLTDDQNLTFFSFLDVVGGILQDPAGAGFTNVTTSCISAKGGSPDIDCTGYFFFDEVHPTTAVHQQIANAILGQLSAVPEPGTWAMMVFGFGAVGFSLRASRRREALAPA